VEEMAEPTARCLEAGAGVAVGKGPGGLADPGAGSVARVEARAPGAEDERVGGDEADFLSRSEASLDAAGEGVDEGAGLPRCAGVAGGRDDGHVVVGIGLERGAQLGELGVVDAVLPADLAGRADEQARVVAAGGDHDPVADTQALLRGPADRPRPGPMWSGSWNADRGTRLLSQPPAADFEGRHQAASLAHSR
jgi:hypothetical protein